MLKSLWKRLRRKTPEERARKRLFSTKLRPSDIVIDCGANVGDVSRRLAPSGATIYAFEPNPFAFRVLSDAVSEWSNVHCVRKGVLDRNGSARLYLHEFSSQDEVAWSAGSSMLEYKSNVLRDKYVEIEIIDLSEFIFSLNSKIKILKVDVEGVECKILTQLIETGAIDLIERVFVETHDERVPELRDETNALRQLIRDKGLKKINLDWT